MDLDLMFEMRGRRYDSGRALSSTDPNGFRENGFVQNGHYDWEEEW